MKTELQPHHSRPPILRRAAAGIVLIIAGVLAVSLVVTFVKAVFVTVLVVVGVIAVLWALKTLLW